VKLQGQIEDAIRDQVNTDFGPGINRESTIYEEHAAQAVKNTIRDSFAQANAPTILGALSPFTPLITPEDLQNCFDRIVDERLQGIDLYSKPESSTVGNEDFIASLEKCIEELDNRATKIDAERVAKAEEARTESAAQEESSKESEAAQEKVDHEAAAEFSGGE